MYLRVQVGEWHMVDSLLTHFTALSAGGHADGDPCPLLKMPTRARFIPKVTPLSRCHGPWGWLRKSNEALLLCNTSGGVTGGRADRPAREHGV